MRVWKAAVLFHPQIHDYVGLHIMNSNSWYNDFFSPRDVMHSAVLTQYSICLSVCDALQVGLPVPCSHRLSLEFFKNNFMAEYVKAYALADPNMGDLVQWEHPKITIE